jgi:dihydrodipicolinate synthase/N-acetylneuraminate lyase
MNTGTQTHTPFLSGLGAAIPTLRAGGGTTGAIDEPGTASLVKFLVHSGVDLVLAGGTTGRGSTLTFEERRELAEIVSAVVPEIRVIIGVPHGTGDEELGALGSVCDAVLVAFPGAVRPGEVVSMRDRARAAGVALVAYHHPSEHDPLNPELYPVLAGEEIQVKNSDPDPGVFAAMQHAGVSMLVGSSRNLLRAYRTHGVISGIASVRPELVRLALAGDLDAAAEILHLEQTWSKDRLGRIEHEAYSIAARARN